jgi:hypothetical protein
MIIRSWRVASVAVVTALFVAAAVLFPTHAFAATSGPALSLTSSPVTLNLVIKPGTSTSKTLQLRNNGSQPLQINMKLQVFSAYGTSGEAAISEPKPGDPSATWVHFSPSTFTAQPGVLNTVKMTIALPKGASLGYYYAVIFQPVIATPTSVSTPSSTVKGSNAILVLVDTQSANENRNIKIASFTATKKVYEYLPATFNVSIHNGGNIFLAPTGNIFISKNANLTHTLDILPFNPGGGNVLPDSNRTFNINWSDGFPIFKPETKNGQPVDNKQGNPVEKLDWNFSNINHIRIGKYYAQLALVYTNGTQVVPVTGVISFWVIPWKMLLVAFVILLLVGFGLFMIIRGIIRKIMKFRRKRR